MKKIIVGVIIAAAAFAARSDVIANWNNDGLVGNEASKAANTLIANADTAVITRNFTATTFTDTFAMKRGYGASLADAILGGVYFTISLSAADGYSFETLTSLFIRLEANNRVDGANVALFSDATGFTEGDEIWAMDLAALGNNQSQHTIDLSGETALQGVTDVNFRLYSWGSSSQYNALAIGRGYTTTNPTDDLTISGTVGAVPEPATVGMLGLGALVAMVARRLRS